MPRPTTCGRSPRASSEDLKINILHAGPGTLWTDLEKAGLADLGAGKALAPKK